LRPQPAVRNRSHDALVCLRVRARQEQLLAEAAAVGQVGLIHSTGAGSSRAWVRARRQGFWFENTKLNHLVHIIPVDKLDLGCGFPDR
jgi:hypothetical protein